MLSMLQNIRNFVDTKLGDIVPWSQCMPNVDPAKAGDHAAATIPIGDMRFKISVASAYNDPPLGKVTMRDELGATVEGAKRDDVWAQIATHIRRRVTEKRTGGTPVPAAVAVEAAAPVPAPSPLLDVSRLPYLGMAAKFILGRGEVIGGMTELAAIVTRVSSPTRVSLTIFPDTGDTFFRNSVPRFGRQEDGSILETGCWDFPSPEPVTKCQVDYEDLASFSASRFKMIGSSVFTRRETGEPVHAVLVATTGVAVGGAEPIKDASATHQPSAQQAQAALKKAQNERDTLLAEAKRRGIEVDGRWGAERLRKVIEDAA